MSIQRGSSLGIQAKQNGFFDYLHKHWMLYAFLLPGLVFFVMFVYMPMIGLISAFQSYNIIGGIFKSEFIGLANFQEIMKTPAFYDTLRNTIVINLLKIFLIFPTPIIFALMLSMIKGDRFKKINQTISYLPHFVSWVVVAGLWTRVLSANGGIINEMLMLLNITKESVNFVGDTRYYYAVIVLQDMWKGLGYSAIYFIAAMASVDVQQYEAAKIDGANRFKQMWYITLPSIMTTIVLLFVLSFSSILNANFDQMINMDNIQIRSIGDVIDTYIFRVLLNQNASKVGLGAALSLFKGAIGFVLFLVCNGIIKKVSDRSFI